MDIQLSENIEEEKLHFQKFLNDYSSKNKKISENIKDYTESEQILAEVKRDFIDATGDPQAGLELIKKARGKDKRNENVYLMQARLYEKLGDQKNKDKALKEATDTKEKNLRENRSY